MEVDDALSKLGKFNRWRIITYCLVCSSVTISGCWHMMSIVFTGGEPQHHCKLEDGESLNNTIPMVPKGKRFRYSQCTRYANFSINNLTIPCPSGWEYDTHDFDSTIVTEWDLVCDKNYLVETSQSVFNFGVMVGAIVFTSLADCIGRKPVHLGCQYLMFIISLSVVFAPNYITFVVLRFLHGAVREGAGLVGIVMACELFPASQRTFAGTALELFWAAAWMALALIAYLIRNWRYLQLAITLPSLLTIALIWLLPESIPWLAANNRIDEADTILRKAARGGIDFPKAGEILHRHKEVRVAATSSEDDLDENNLAKDGELFKNNVLPNVLELSSENHSENTNSRENSKPSTTPFATRLNHLKGRIGDRICVRSKKCQSHRLDTQLTCLDMMKSKKMVLYTFIMCSLWFASGVVYFGLSLGTSTLAGDKYVNFFLSGAVEAPAYGLTVVVLQKFGRRWPLFLFHTTAGVVLFANIFIPHETDSGTDLTPVITTLTLIGKFAITAAFGTVVLYAPEIYPTNLRNFGFGMASVWGRIGGMISPFCVYLGKTNDWIPSVIFTIVALLTGILALFLPETLNRALPDTIEDIESWTRSSKPKKELKSEHKITPNEQKTTNDI